MTVASLQLLLDDGRKGPLIKPSARTVDAAINVMVAEARTPWAHRLLFIMADGSAVVAKVRGR